MPVEVRVPPLGESLVDAVVGSWLKGEGETVARGETLVELETDKVNLDVAATDDGVLQRIDRQEGEVVQVGDILGLVGEGNGAAPSPSNGTEPKETEPAAPSEPAAVVAQQPVKEAAPPESDEQATDEGGGRAAPTVKRLAEEHHLDLNAIAGTGPGGRVTREDVMAAASASSSSTAPTQAQAPTAPTAQAQPATPAATPTAPAPPTPAMDGREERVRMSRRRQTIANRLVEAQQTAAMLTTFNEIDMTAVMELRGKRKETFKERHGVGLGFMSFFTKATVGALKAFPRLNAEMQGDEIVLKHYYDIGIAVGVEEGLVVPVVRDAERKSFAEIEQTIVNLATKAKDGKLALSDLQGGTFSITNGGIFGSLLSTPILNTPQVGILGMHSIQQRPIAKDGEVAIKPMMYVALSYDHRIVDGQEAVRFLVRIKELIEDPTTLLLEG